MPFGIVAIKLPPLKLAKLIRAHGQRQSRETEKGTVREEEKKRETEREDTGVNSCNRHASPGPLPHSVFAHLPASPSLVLPFPDSLPSFFRRKKKGKHLTKFLQLARNYYKIKRRSQMKIFPKKR